MIDVRDLAISRGERGLWKGVQFCCDPGCLVAIGGPIGSGKTTLLRTIAGLEQPSAGTIVTDGVVWNGTSSLAPWRRSVALAFQEGALWPELSVEEHLREVLPATGPRDWRSRRQSANELVQLWDLGTLRRRRPENLSGGQQGLLGVARACARRARVTLLDEPAAHLDTVSAQGMWDTLNSWRERHETMVIAVSHSGVPGKVDRRYRFIDQTLEPE